MRLKETEEDEFDSYFCVSNNHPPYSQLLHAENDQFVSVDIPHFDHDAATIFLRAMKSRIWIQVTSHTIRIIDRENDISKLWNAESKSKERFWSKFSLQAQFQKQQEKKNILSFQWVQL